MISTLFLIWCVTLDNEFGKVVQPIFISCDPGRDTVERTAAYVQGASLPSQAGVG